VELPKQADRITLDSAFVARHPYPPLGFLPFLENQLGNGDYFGLYWPVGRETEEPLVVEMQHDGWSMCPAFSSLDAFLASRPDSLQWVEPPDARAGSRLAHGELGCSAGPLGAGRCPRSGGTPWASDEDPSRVRRGPVDSLEAAPSSGMRRRRLRSVYPRYRYSTMLGRRLEPSHVVQTPGVLPTRYSHDPLSLWVAQPVLQWLDGKQLRPVRAGSNER
jgi:hypothetical protein